MKRTWIFIFLLACMLAVTAACSDADAEVEGEETQKKVTLKFAVPQPETHNMNREVFQPFMEKVTELTDGQVDFEFYPAEQLGKIDDLFILAGDGVTDIAFYYPTYHTSQMPINSALIQMPGLYASSYEGSMAMHSLMKEDPILETDFLNNNVRPIFYYAAQSSELFTKEKEVRVPEDLKNKKMRVSGKVGNKMTAELGATPINITLAEMYEGFERGVFDIVNLNTASMNDYGMSELIGYGTAGVMTGGNGGGLVINEKTFQSLPENVQEAIIQVGDELVESNAKFYDEYAASLAEEWKEAGIVLHELTEEEQEKWQQFYDEIEANLLKEVNHAEVEPAIEAFREEVQKYN